MSIRTKVLGMVDVMMRVPPIIVIDEILKIGMGLPSRSYQTTNSVDAGGGLSADTVVISDVTNPTTLLNNSSADNATNLSQTSTSAAYDLFNNFTNVANATLEQAIDNATTAAAAGGILSSSFGAMLEDIAKDTYLSDLLSITSVKFIICILGK